MFCVTAATFAWSALLLSGVHTDAPAHATETEHEHAGLWAGFRAIRAEPRLRLLIGLYGAQALAAGTLTVLVVATALDLLSMGNAGVGLLEAMSGIGSVAGAAIVLALVRRKRLAADFGLGLVAWGAPLAVIGLLPHSAVALVAFAVLGVGNTLVDVSAITLLQRATPVEVAGRVFGVLESVLVGALGVGALLAPALIALIGVRGTLLSVGIALPALAVALQAEAGRGRRGRRDPRRPPGRRPRRAVPRDTAAAGRRSAGHAAAPSRRGRRRGALRARRRRRPVLHRHRRRGRDRPACRSEGRGGALLRGRDRPAARHPEDGDGSRYDPIRALGARAGRLPRAPCSATPAATRLPPRSPPSGSARMVA